MGLFIYLWLCWVFVSVRGLSPVTASGGHSSSRCAGLSLLRPLLLQSTGSRRAGSVVVAHGPSRSTACGIFPDHGSNPCPLCWQADSQPLRHQGSPTLLFLIAILLRCNSHTTQPTHLNRTIRWILVYSQSCATITTISFRTFASSLKGNPLPIISHSPYPCPQLLETTNLLFVSTDLSFLGISHKWNHTICDLSCLAFTQHHVFKVHPHCGMCRNSITLYG